MKKQAVSSTTELEVLAAENSCLDRSSLCKKRNF